MRKELTNLEKAILQHLLASVVDYPALVETGKVQVEAPKIVSEVSYRYAEGSGVNHLSESTKVNHLHFCLLCEHYLMISL